MADRRQRRSLLVRIRDKLADPAPAAEPAFAVEAVTEPEPPRRIHMFGSQYRVRMSFEELMARRGYTGLAALYRNNLTPATGAQQQSDAAVRRGGYTAGEVLWPSD